MPTMTEIAQTSFDPEAARRAIEADLEDAQRAWRLVLIVPTGMLGATLFSAWAIPDHDGVDWMRAVEQTSIFILAFALVTKCTVDRARRRAHESAQSVEALERVYLNRPKSDPSHRFRVVMNVLLALILVFSVCWMVSETGSLAIGLVYGACFLLWVLVIAFSLDRRHIDRLRRRMSWRGDSSSPAS